jgi:pSer/pThr/pTyr-binding forkhead associated (FHA) protein
MGSYMKLSLKVLTAGKWEGKVIPITLAQFVIGRDPQCHLRPASPVISKRHCAILRKQDKVFLRDFGSTNGSFVNGAPVKGEVELKDNDHVKVGPIEFNVSFEAVAAPQQAKVNEPTPLPVNKALVPAPAVAQAGASDDETMADMLMSLVDDGPPPTPSGLAGTIPEGSTVMEIPSIVPPGEPGSDAAKREEKAKAAKASTSDAARSLLDKYMKGKRS